METFLQAGYRFSRYYKQLADDAISRLTDAQLHARPDPEANSIAIIMQHMAGNMLSRWTDFLTTDGEKPDRLRDAEFEPQQMSRTDLLALWERGWQCYLNAFHSITEADLDRIIYVRHEGHTVSSAFIRQYMHYSYHIGQIIWIARSLAGPQWQSLSIPRNQSDDYLRAMADKFGTGQ